MKNPLNKRLPRELKRDAAKYIIMFAFMLMLISAVSAFLVTDHSVSHAYHEGFTKYNIEDGNIAFNIKPGDELLDKLEEKGDLKFYDLRYVEEGMGKANIRIYKDRTDVDLACLMSGEMPKAENEIALDRMFADNNDIVVGDTITLRNKDFTVSGLIALPDYSCLFESNTDMMFDAINFSVAIVSPAGFDYLDSKHITYNYAWKYNTPYENDSEANERSEDFIDALEDVIKDYDKAIIQAQVDDLYDQADVLADDLSNEFDKASEAIEDKLSEPIKEVAMEAVFAFAGNMPAGVNSLDNEDDVMKLIDAYADKLGKNKWDLIADKLDTNTTGASLKAMMDAIDDADKLVDDASVDTSDREIDWDALEDAEDYENDMDFSMDDISELVAKISATNLYNTTKLENTIAELEELANTEIDDSEIISVKNYIPRYENQAINFTGEDMGSDKAMFLVFDYILTAILAFVFAVTTSNTIVQEATVIGTLRASGYSRKELLKHYMVLPVAVTIAAGIIGNIFGYTFMKYPMVNIYYSNYSLCSYVTLWNAEAFIDTTVVPIILMFIINLIVISSKLKLSPLRFLRRDLSKRGKKKAFKLNTKIPIMTRFRLRILFQNIPNYIVLFFGIFFGGVIIIFGFMFKPLLVDFGELMVDTRIADYQYIMMDSNETETEGAEKYCMTSLESNLEGYMTDTISIFGIVPGSTYIKADIPANEVLISDGYAAKYGLKPGDTITLDDKYSSTTYSFKVADEYTYAAGLAIFMNYDEYLTMFKENDDYLTGYFSNQEITDVDEDDIVSVITIDDLTKVSDQLMTSMGNFVRIFSVFGVIIFLMMMFLMSKQVIEKNAQSISMTKILGYKQGEIGGLYIVATSIVVVISLLATIPLTDIALRILFKTYIYTAITGYIPYIISNSCYIIMFVLGIIAYVAVAFFLMKKIDCIPKSDALKNVE